MVLDGMDFKPPAPNMCRGEAGHETLIDPSGIFLCCQFFLLCDRFCEYLYFLAQAHVIASTSL